MKQIRAVIVVLLVVALYLGSDVRPCGAPVITYPVIVNPNNTVTAGVTYTIFETVNTESNDVVVESYIQDIVAEPAPEIEPETKEVVVEEEPEVIEPTVPECYKTYSASKFRRMGIVHYGNYTYTWYSEKVLPGGGLHIPGRHLNSERFVVDENEYLVVASDDLPKGTIVDTPVGIKGIVRDCGSGHGNLDIYVSW